MFMLTTVTWGVARTTIALYLRGGNRENREVGCPIREHTAPKSLLRFTPRQPDCRAHIPTHYVRVSFILKNVVWNYAKLFQISAAQLTPIHVICCYYICYQILKNTPVRSPKCHFTDGATKVTCLGSQINQGF